MYRQTPQRRATKTVRRLAGAAGALLLCGCASHARGPGAAQLHRAVDDYNAQRYELARGEAEAVRHRPGPLAGQAAYVQGLSAYQLGSDAEAATALSEAAAHSSGQDSGRARAALGLVELRQGRSAEAAETLRAASSALQGDDARKAGSWAVRASEAAANPQQAAAWGHMLHQSPRRAPAAGGGGGGFTIQVGAFRGRPHAESAAADAAKLGDRQGVAPVRIVTRQDDRGQLLYVVQLGSFESRDEAADARRRVGNLQFIVASMAPG